jgi:hypothetical protein
MNPTLPIPPVVPFNPSPPYSPVANPQHPTSDSPPTSKAYPGKTPLEKPHNYRENGDSMLTRKRLPQKSSKNWARVIL